MFCILTTLECLPSAYPWTLLSLIHVFHHMFSFIHAYVIMITQSYTCCTSGAMHCCTYTYCCASVLHMAMLPRGLVHLFLYLTNLLLLIPFTADAYVYYRHLSFPYLHIPSAYYFFLTLSAAYRLCTCQWLDVRLTDAYQSLCKPVLRQCKAVPFLLFYHTYCGSSRSTSDFPLV